MKVTLFLLLLVSYQATFAQDRPEPDAFETACGTLMIQPIRHASVVLSWGEITLYVDPVGRVKSFADLPPPTLILYTHAHGDHFRERTLAKLPVEGVTLVMPKAIANDLADDLETADEFALQNGESIQVGALTIEAVPMYNLPDSTDGFHPKGWGNGYVVSACGTRVYISGDTEDIPEMRSLEGIDIAFVSMNIPFTMDVERAASAVLEFQPRVVYPYHFRGLWGLSDVDEFQKRVEDQNQEIEVRLRDWYQ